MNNNQLQINLMTLCLRERGEGIVLGVLTTKASTNEIANLDEVLDTADLPENIPLKADKGYQSKKNEAILKKRKLKKNLIFNTPFCNGLTIFHIMKKVLCLHLMMT